MDPNNDPNHPSIAVGECKALPVRWCEYSRPGNDPMKRVKENQDACIVVDAFGGNPNSCFVGVFDGHGVNGNAASTFVRTNLPASWMAQDRLFEKPLESMVLGCLQTSAALAASSIDVYLSGTTGVSAMFYGRHLYVANVGDSRAVLARRMPNGSIRALDLSHDHKPDRPDELSRILECGGRVFEWGVSRVWLRDADMPGLAMSRSYGDLAAESVGVFAEPELSDVELCAADLFIIWATDGVWEFISSQEAVDIVTGFVHDDTPLEAAAALVKESTRRWNEEEDVVDDTTCVIAFLNFKDLPAARPAASSNRVVTAPLDIVAHTATAVDLVHTLPPNDMRYDSASLARDTRAAATLQPLPPLLLQPCATPSSSSELPTSGVGASDPTDLLTNVSTPPSTSASKDSLSSIQSSAEAKHLSARQNAFVLDALAELDQTQATPSVSPSTTSSSQVPLSPASSSPRKPTASASATRGVGSRRLTQNVDTAVAHGDGDVLVQKSDAHVPDMLIHLPSQVMGST